MRPSCKNDADAAALALHGGVPDFRVKPASFLFAPKFITVVWGLSGAPQKAGALPSAS